MKNALSAEGLGPSEDKFFSFQELSKLWRKRRSAFASSVKPRAGLEEKGPPPTGRRDGGPDHHDGGDEMALQN